VKPLVSIIIPAYNAEHLLPETISSALCQTWPRKEIIVIDDGSRDATLSVARRFASRDVRVVTQPSQGAAAARNHGLSLSQGDYVQWLDADDLLAPDKLARQLQAVEEYRDSRTLLSCPWGRFLYRPHRASFHATSLWSDLSPADWLIRKLAHNAFMQTATWLVSRELTYAAGPWDTRMLSDDDGEYFCRVLLASTGTRFVPDTRVFYRVAGPGSLSSLGRSNRKLEALFLSMQLHVGYVRSLEDSERVRSACITYLQTGLPHFYPERMDIVERAAILAKELGGTLTQPPPISWKYAWADTLFGRRIAKRVQNVVRRTRHSLNRSWDRTMSQIHAATGPPLRSVTGARTRSDDFVNDAMHARPGATSSDRRKPS